MVNKDEKYLRKVAYSIMNLKGLHEIEMSTQEYNELIYGIVEILDAEFNDLVRKL